MTLTWFDKEGKPLKDINEWGKLRKDEDYFVIGRTQVGPFRVSTVWLGMEHGCEDGKPLIFETLVFPECEYMERYTTELKAKNGHARMVGRVRHNYDGEWEISDD